MANTEDDLTPLARWTIESQQGQIIRPDRIDAVLEICHSLEQAHLVAREVFQKEFTTADVIAISRLIQETEWSFAQENDTQDDAKK